MKNRKASQEKIRYDKANKYTLDNVPKESSEMFYSDTYEYNNGYFEDIEELDETDIPEYVWGTKAEALEINAEAIVSNILEDWYEDAFDDIDSNALRNLQKACDIFCKECGVGKLYSVDYNVCIELSRLKN